MKTYVFKVTPREREAIYMALCRATRDTYSDEVYTPELLNLLETPSDTIELTLEQLRATFNGLEVGKGEPELDSVHKFEEVRRSLASMGRNTYKLIC